MRLLIKAGLTVTILFSLFASGSTFAKTVGGVALDDALTISDKTLVLNGAGLRKKLFIKLYVGSLYLQQAGNDANAIVAADEAMAIRLNILSGLLTRNKMIKALNEGFSKVTGGDTTAIDPQIEQMLSFMKDKIKPGNSYTLSYEPDVGTHLLRNGAELTVVEGLSFKQALFGIWLSNKPAQKSLKSEMLGK